MKSFWGKVDQRADDECWPWNAARYPNGYGMYRINESRAELAHRMAYALAVGQIPEGLVIDHLCRNRACCNPSHLQAVTQRTNVLRGQSIPAENALKTHCKRGHPFDPKNTMLLSRTDSPHPRRRCRTCYEETHRRYNAGVAAARAANRKPRRGITHCPQGHEYTPENSYIHAKTNKRSCKQCSRESTMRSYYRRRAR